MVDKVKLSKRLSYILRHNPKGFGIELDDEGWVSTDEILKVLTKKSFFKNVTYEDILEIVNTSDKSRFEIENDRIRALYGHSIKKKIEKSPEKPPEFLYHGTTTEYSKIIMEKGLKPMGRQYVHMSVDTNMAERVGSRRQKNPVIIKINALNAWKEGGIFLKGNDLVWLSDFVSPKYLEIIKK